MDPVTLIFGIVMLVASFAITALTTPRPKTQEVKPALITDFQFPQSAEGQPQSVIFGDVWSPDYQVLWYGNYRNTPIITKTGSKK